jgi:hypothetical protein
MPYYPQNPYEPIMTGMESLSGAIRDVRTRDIDRMKEKRLAEQEKMNAQFQNAQVMKGLAIQEAGLQREAMQDRFAAMNAYREDIDRQKRLDISKFEAGTQRMGTESDILTDEQRRLESQQNILESQFDINLDTPQLPSQIPIIKQILESKKITDKDLSLQQRDFIRKIQELENLGAMVTPRFVNNLFESHYALSPAAYMVQKIATIQPIADSLSNIKDFNILQSYRNQIAQLDPDFTLVPFEYTIKYADIVEGERIERPREQESKSARPMSDEEFQGVNIPQDKKLITDDDNTTMTYTGFEILLDGRSVAMSPPPPPPDVGIEAGAYDKEQIRSMYKKFKKEQLAESVLPMITAPGAARFIPEKKKKLTTGQMYQEIQKGDVFPSPEKQAQKRIPEISADIKDAEGIPNYRLRINALDMTNDTVLDWLYNAVKDKTIPNSWVFETPDGKIITIQQLIDTINIQE